MTNLGMGVMLQMLGGDYGQNTYQQAIGKTIEDCRIENNELRFYFTDKTSIALWDNGQSCCEYRYMHTDDKPGDFIGAVFNGVELREGGNSEMEYGDVKESQFLIVNTSKGQFTVVNYNEHNGYYGGFALQCKSL